ncbi:hypothetical protein [Falsiroseomonas oryzae]|uniref:hypothetical protein n=1 Tax=Falsiroseomonas oryzae TaxID=2766473 RepID=UPI0022EB5991|nr:hypothetical protein [Roseomonas sp. MO-31]
MRHDFGGYRQAEARRRAAEAALLGRIEARLAALAERPLPPCGGTRSLVMGLAANYGPAELAPFVRSLRAGGHAGEAVLLLAGNPPETRAFLEVHGVRAVHAEALPLLAMSPNSARMFCYLDHLIGEVLAADGTTPYRHVLLTDTRDVVFQGDPFARAGAAEALFFLERPGRTIGGCPVNAGWMRLALGEAGLRRWADAPVSCAGTFLATPRALLAYLLHMCRLILLAPPAARQSGIDQAIHNHILQAGLVPGTLAVPNGDAVTTVPDDAPHGLAVAPDGLLRHADGRASEIVHQYDRVPELRAAVARRWGAGDA